MARVVKAQEHSSATTLELFFDLVFVFALTQVTAMMAHEASWTGLLHGLLVMGIVWWCWVCYSWLGNVVRADEGFARLAVYVAMGGLFLMALTIPEAFHDFEGGLSGPMVFAVCYLLVRAVHIGLFVLVSRDDAGLRAQVVAFSATTALSTLLLLLAAGLHGTAQVLLWAAVLLVDYGAVLLLGNREGRTWRLRSPRHFAERHGLIIIVALGESIVALGVGVADKPISWAVVAASVLGLSVSGSLWWAYFDLDSLRAEHRFSRLEGKARVVFAQHAYTYLHLPMLAGIVLLALGLKKVLTYVADGDTAHALDLVALVALLGGVAMFLLAHLAFEARTGCGLSWPKVGALVAVLAMIPVGHALHLPALIPLAALAVVLAALNVWETVAALETRDEVRSTLAG